MKFFYLFIDFLVIFLIFDGFIISKNYTIAVPILCFYIAYKLFKYKSSIFAFKGNLAFEKKDYEKALKFYEKACTVNNVDDSTKLKYAYILLYCGNTKRCKEMLELIESNKLQSNLKNSYLITEAMFEWKTGNLRNALQKCKSIDKDFKHTLIYETLGYLLLVNGSYEEALAYNKEAFEFNDSSLIIIDNLAQSYFFLKDYAQAKALYKNMLMEKETKPSFSEPYYYYGLISKNEGNLDSALEYFNIALSKNEVFLSDLTHNKINESISSINLAATI